MIDNIPSINLGYLVDKKAHIHPNRVAVVQSDSGGQISYGELQRRSNACAAYLQSLGIERGDTVAVVCANRCEFFDLLLACAKLGAILVPTNFRLSDQEIARILESAKSKVVFYDDQCQERVVAWENDQRLLVNIEHQTYTSSDANNDWPYAAAQDPLCLIYTSGSSGKPKGVIQTHQNIFFKSIDSIVDWGMTYDEVVLVAAPLFHVAGLNSLTLPALHVGATLVLQQRFDAEETLQIIEARGVTCFAVVPTILRIIANTPSFSTHCFNSLRFILAGGEPLEPELQELFQSKGVTVLNVFGMSEVTNGVIYQRAWDVEADGSAGRVATHAMLRIGNEAEGDKNVGELYIGGPIVSPGYWNEPTLTESTFRDGWVATGDIAQKDASGRVFLVGRTDDMIKSGAEKIAPAELEQVINALPGVADVVVFGVPHEKWGAVPRAVVAIKEGEEVTKEMIIDACCERLASYKKPDSVLLVKELPLTGSGKVDRTAVKSRYGSGVFAE